MKETIQNEFSRGYFDLGIYRMYNRNLQTFAAFMIGTWAVSVIGALLSKYVGWWPSIIGGGLFILAAFAGAIDHMIIGRSFSRILKRLKKKGITITRQSLLHYCADIMPH
jgi:hypothetical protein